jgi:hypothetical protein
MSTAKAVRSLATLFSVKDMIRSIRLFRRRVVKSVWRKRYALILAYVSLASSPALASFESCVSSSNSKDDVIITRQDGELRGARKLLKIDYAGIDYSKATDGPPYRFSITGLLDRGATAKDLPNIIDNLMISLQIASDKKTAVPSLLYITRNDYIPLDIVPAKLWYPEYYKNNEYLEFITTLGDLERAMQIGPMDGPADRIGWILKTVGEKAFDDKLIDSGEIPLAPIWEAKKVMSLALQNCFPKE